MKKRTQQIRRRADQEDNTEGKKRFTKIKVNNRKRENEKRADNSKEPN